MCRELDFRLSLKFFISLFHIEQVRDVDAQFELVGTGKIRKPNLKWNVLLEVTSERKHYLLHNGNFHNILIVVFRYNVTLNITPNASCFNIFVMQKSSLL